MKSHKEFLQSGIVERFCLGCTTPAETERLLLACQQSPALQVALKDSQSALEQYASSFQHQAPAHLKHSIINHIHTSSQLENAQLLNGQLKHYFAPSPYTKAQHWQRLLSSLQAPTAYDNVHYHPIYKDEEKILMVLWIKENIPPETHPELEECFIILEGQCTCHIGGQILQLKTGDFLRLPQEGLHELRVTSAEPVKAILSRIQVA
ncbi:MAG: cupin domain-containing protein [Bacteroidota bacterium]